MASCDGWMDACSQIRAEEGGFSWLTQGLCLSL